MLPPRAYIFIGLNIVRVLSIVSLLLVFASSIVVIVSDVRAVNAFEAAKQSITNSTDTTTLMEGCDYIAGSTVPNQPAGVFWAILSRLLLIFEVVVLILSEIGWPAVFFDRFFPVLGQGFGLGALGIFQCLIGATILSHKVSDFSLVSAFFLFSFGCLNMLLGLIFREKAKTRRSITTWRSEAKGILPTSVDNRPVFTNASNPSFVPNVFSPPTSKAYEAGEFGSAPYLQRGDSNTTFVSRNDSTSKAGYGFGRQGEKAAGLKGFLLTKPVESLPRYAAARPVSVAESISSDGSSHRSSTSSFASPNASPTNTPAHSQEFHSPTPVPEFKSSKTSL